MIDAFAPDRRVRPRGWFVPAPLAPALALLIPLGSVCGCGDPAPATTSPVVAVDSEEGRKALAEDQAARELLKKKEAKAARRKRVDLPVDSE